MFETILEIVIPCSVFVFFTAMAGQIFQYEYAMAEKNRQQPVLRSNNPLDRVSHL